MIKKLLVALVVVTALVVGGGTFAIWSFKAYPVTTINIVRPTTVGVPSANDQTDLLAGIAERDITAPIGIPKMGYSAWARPADGFRTRLKVRAFYLKARDSEPVVVVQADLPASSLVLRHKVAEAVSAVTDIPFGALSIHVTHTHSGPGQYFESDFYNNFGSNEPGFDPDVFDFLVRQTRDAVVEAWKQRRPARLAIGQTEIYGATKNRSVAAWSQNRNVEDKRADDASALRAVNPRLTLVRIDVREDDGSFKPWGAFSTFAIHGTGIPPFTHPYHGDVWAFLERDLQARIKSHYQPSREPVHGPFEANHGDNNPNYVKGLRGDRETRRIGLMIADRAWDLFRSLDGSLTDQVPVRHAMREIDLLAPRGDEAAPMCARAVVGAATVGAAHGDEVFPISYLPPFRSGWPKQGATDCHAQKQWMLSWLQVWGVEPSRYPHRVNASVVQIGDLWLAGLPFEITFESGNRIEAALRERLGQAGVSPRYVVVSSHTDGFFGYSTTPEEYSAQFYEGGHTLYGPGTTDFLSKTAATLAADLVAHPGVTDMPPLWRFDLASRHYFPAARPFSGSRGQLSEPVFKDSDGLLEARWSFTYRDVPPANIALDQPLLSVEISTDGEHWQALNNAGVRVDDQGVDLQLRHLGDEAGGMAGYQVLWFNPAERPGLYRIAIEPRGGLPRWTSSAFGSVR